MVAQTHGDIVETLVARAALIGRLIDHEWIRTLFADWNLQLGIGLKEEYPLADRQWGETSRLGYLLTMGSPKRGDVNQ